jgi:Outer membrane protein beta-barrel domain
MRITCLPILLAFISPTLSHAQFLKIGPKVGANLVKIEGQAFSDGYQLGYYAGAFAELKLAKNWYIQPELLFNETQFDQSSDFRDIYRNLLKPDSLMRIKLQALSIPITLNWKIANVLSLTAGAQFSAFMNKGDGLLQNAGNAFTNGDISMLAGANIMLGKLRINGRYGWGMKDINNTGKQDPWKQQTAQIGLGLVL